jgi:TetR/AcrR family transcriptional regulator, lmrAB and yxaGH operons repressor
MFAILLLGSARDVFHGKVKALFCGWIDAIAAVLVEAGMERALAQQRGKDAAIAVQGALILAQALDDPSPFIRVMQQLLTQLCQAM